jgi:fatty-acyl-CoA synthase
MVGYFGRPEATAEAFHDGWMRTGKEMIIVGGLNVYPAEVERVLLDMDAVAEVAVVGVPDPDWGEVPLAVVIAKPGRSVSPTQLEEHCRQELANYKVPKRWTIRGEPLPRTTSGKIQRHLLAAPAQEVTEEKE